MWYGRPCENGEGSWKCFYVIVTQPKLAASHLNTTRSTFRNGRKLPSLNRGTFNLLVRSKKYIYLRVPRVLTRMYNEGNSEVVILPIPSAGHSKAFARFAVKMFGLVPPFSTGHGLVRRTGVWQLIEVRYLEIIFELLLLSMELPLLPSVVRRTCFFTVWYFTYKPKAK